MPSNKPVNIELISSDADLLTTCRPYLADSSSLQWLKQTPPWISNGVATWQKDVPISDKINKTVKSCPGIASFTNAGVIIPLWLDLHVKYDSYQGSINLTSPSEALSYHLHTWQQYNHSPLYPKTVPYNYVVNLHSPWLTTTPPGYSSLLIHPYWSTADDAFTIVPGIVNHDSFHSLHIIFSWNLKGQGELVIPRGTPFAQIIPLARAPVTLSLKIDKLRVDEIASGERSRLQTVFKNYRKLFGWERRVR